MASTSLAVKEWSRVLWKLNFRIKGQSNVGEQHHQAHQHSELNSTQLCSTTSQNTSDQFIMKPSTVLSILFASATSTVASPIAGENTAAAVTCTPGYIYCGWTLIDQFGTHAMCSPAFCQHHPCASYSLSLVSQLIQLSNIGYDSETMRRSLCNKLGDCKDNWGHPWDSVWSCNSRHNVEPVKWCGGGGKCKPDNVGC